MESKIKLAGINIVTVRHLAYVCVCVCVCVCVRLCVCACWDIQEAIAQCVSLTTSTQSLPIQLYH